MNIPTINDFRIGDRVHAPTGADGKLRFGEVTHISNSYVYVSIDGEGRVARFKPFSLRVEG